MPFNKTSLLLETSPIHSPLPIKTDSLASGAPVPLDVEVDMLREKAIGKAAKADLIRRLQSRLRMPLRPYQQEDHPHIFSGKGNNYGVAISDSSCIFKWCIFKRVPVFVNVYILLVLQIIQYQEQSNLAFLLLVKSQSQDETWDLGELMKYCPMPVPPSLATPDRFFS